MANHENPETNTDGNPDRQNVHAPPVPYVKERKEKPDPSSGDHHHEEKKNKEKYQRKIERDQRLMPVLEHVDELRWAVIRSFIWIAVFAGISMFFYDEIFKVMINPVGHLIDAGKQKNIVVKVMVTKLTDYVIVQFKLTIIVGFLLAIPAIIFEIMRFIMPALQKQHRKKSFVVLFFSVLFFWSGTYLAWRYLWDHVIQFLVITWTPPGIQTAAGIQMPEVNLTMDDYFSFFLGFHLTIGAVCQMPIICVLLAMIGIINSKTYFKQWRMVILVSAIAAAAITPPDVMSMMFMMVPLIGLYFFSGILVFIFQKRTKA